MKVNNGVMHQSRFKFQVEDWLLLAWSLSDSEVEELGDRAKVWVVPLCSAKVDEVIGTLTLDRLTTGL